MAESRNEAKKKSPARSGRLAERRRKPPPPNYFSRSEQYRLLVMCATLMLVLAMMNEARKPRNWNWVWAQGTAATVIEPEQPIDTKADVTDRTLPPDGFTVDTDPSRKPITPLPAVEQHFLPGITKELLASIQDNTVMRAAENDAWLTMLGILKERDDTDLRALSTGSVTFSQLYRQTDIYRGQLVTVRGTVHRVEDIQARDNEYDIEMLYRWIIEPAGSSNSPIVIYSLEKPAGFPAGDDLREEATFTGFCFKRWAYAAGDGTRIAPLLLAKNATWRPAPAVEPVRLPAVPISIAILIGIAGLSVIISWAVYRSSVAQRPEITRLRAQLATGVNQINDDEVLPAVSEALRDLAESQLPDETS